MTAKIKSVDGGIVSDAVRPPVPVKNGFITKSTGWFLAIIMVSLLSVIVEGFLTFFPLPDLSGSLQFQTQGQELIINLSKEQTLSTFPLHGVMAVVSILLIPVGVLLLKKTLSDVTISSEMSLRSTLFLGIGFLSILCVLFVSVSLAMMDTEAKPQPATTDNGKLSANILEADAKITAFKTRFYPALSDNQAMQLLKEGVITLGFGSESVTYTITEDTETRLIVTITDPSDER